MLKVMVMVNHNHNHDFHLLTTSVNAKYYYNLMLFFMIIEHVHHKCMTVLKEAWNIF